MQTSNNNLFKQMRKPLHKIDENTGNRIPPEEVKKYILFIFYNEESEQPVDKTFEVITGRKNAYEYIKNNIDDIDVLESNIMRDNVTLYDSITIYAFMKHMENYFEDEEFNIREYLELSRLYDPEKSESFYEDKGDESE